MALPGLNSGRLEEMGRPEGTKRGYVLVMWHPPLPQSHQQETYD